MSAHQGWKTASLMLSIATATAAAPLLAQHDRPAAKGERGPAVIAVKPAKLKGVVRQQGWLERAKIVEVACPVEGRTTIRSLVPQGSAVKAGDVVCELDLYRSVLADGLINQEIATTLAEGAYENAKLEREVAEIDFSEYTEGTGKQEELPHDKTIEVLKANIEKARSTELATQQSWELEKDKLIEYPPANATCELRAPIDGIVALRSPAIGPGASVEPGDTLLSVSSGPLVARVALPGVLKDRIAVGNPARILPAFEPATFNVLNGVVEHVDTAPRGSRRQHADGENACIVTIKLAKPPLLLGPGLRVLVEVAAKEIDGALVVPREAVRQTLAAALIAVVNPDGGFDWRQVTLGAGTDMAVEIVQGLKSGESVLADATALPSSGGS